VTLTNGEVIQAEAVERLGFAYVRVHRTARDRRDVRSMEVRSIVGADGQDRTQEVLVGGGRVGSVEFESRWAHARSRTHSGRRAFPLFELGAFGVLSGSRPNPLPTTYVSGLVTPSSYLSFEFGGMRNLGNGNALGGTAFLGGDETGSREGLRIRYRRWLGTSTYLDLAPGLVLAAESGDYAYRLPGFAGHVSVGVSDLISATIEEHILSVKGMFGQNGIETEKTTYAGIRLGSGKGLWYPLGVYLALGIAVAATWN